MLASLFCNKLELGSMAFDARFDRFSFIHRVILLFYLITSKVGCIGETGLRRTYPRPIQVTNPLPLTMVFTR